MIFGGVYRRFLMAFMDVFWLYVWTIFWGVYV